MQWQDNALASCSPASSPGMSEGLHNMSGATHREGPSGTTGDQRTGVLTAYHRDYLESTCGSADAAREGTGTLD